MSPHKVGFLLYAYFFTGSLVTIMTRTEKCYEGLLKSLDMSIVGDDSVIAIGDKTGDKPVMIDGKRLVMPTKENIDKLPSFWESNVAFHPISENIYRSDSEVTKRLQTFIVAKVSTDICYLLITLIKLAATKEKHPDLNPSDQHKILDILKDADRKTITFVNSVISASGGANRSYRIMRCHTKANGQHNGKKWKKVLSVSFPLMTDKRVTTDSSIFGVKGRKSDVAMVKNLFEYILPDSSKPGEYSEASNDGAAPAFHAIATGYLRILKKINTIYDIFMEHLDVDYNPDVTWADDLDKLIDLKNEILPLEGNKGSIYKAQGETPVKDETQQNTVVETGQDEAVSCIEVGQDGAVSWSDICKARAATAAVSPMVVNGPTFGRQPFNQHPPMNNFGNNPVMAGFNANPQMNNFGNNPPMNNFGSNPAMGGFNANPQMNNFGNNPPMNNFGNNPAMGGFNTNPPMNNFGNNPVMAGFNANPPMNNFGNNPAMGGFNANPPMNNFGNNPAMRGFNANPPMNNFGNNPAMGGFNTNPPMNNFGNNPAMSGFNANPQMNNFGNNQPNNQPQFSGPQGVTYP